ncbi:EAL domain-containing protein [Sulfurovum sp.]|uniref:EAL domain-containing protein n=1 Tax=Sulfurovum sp. TaxID=1969726 RepID=UPI0025CF44DE|nr:EAL domain-containing protein [Sulfurovum sp.]
MLLSEREERERRFKLALRAGIPILLLVSLVFYSLFFRGSHIHFNLETTFIMMSILFITVYFIYFLIDLSVKETLIDQTTQGFNQKAFITKLQKYRPKTLVLLIVKNLSTINENYSAEQVDLLLYNIIHKLNQEFRKYGLNKVLIARRYGAEFLIAIDRDSDDIETILENFITKYRNIDDIELDYTYAAVTNTGKELEKDIIYLKDLIAIEEKSFNIPADNHKIQDATELSKIEQSILFALKHEKLYLSFRPILNTGSNQIDMYEISAKLHDQKGADILPRVYLPIINRIGLGREYDMVLLKHIISLLPLVDAHISFSFNLSPFSLRDESFQKQFFSLLEQQVDQPSRLIIELYERKTHHNLSGYLKTLKKFRAQGIRIAIDNFGSSNASMEYMKHFNFDLVQFDRDYVTKLDDTTTYAMLSSLVSMSKELGIVTVAKWVDNTVQKEKLIALGIDYLQGFGIGKPINETKLLKQYN